MLTFNQTTLQEMKRAPSVSPSWMPAEPTPPAAPSTRPRFTRLEPTVAKSAIGGHADVRKRGALLERKLTSDPPLPCMAFLRSAIRGRRPASDVAYFRPQQCLGVSRASVIRLLRARKRAIA